MASLSSSLSALQPQPAAAYSGDTRLSQYGVAEVTKKPFLSIFLEKTFTGHSLCVQCCAKCQRHKEEGRSLVPEEGPLLNFSEVSLSTCYVQMLCWRLPSPHGKQAAAAD